MMTTRAARPAPTGLQRFSPRVRDAIWRDVSEAWPDEAVGVVLGSSAHEGALSEVRPLPGGHRGGFSVPDAAWLETFTHAAATAAEVRVLYHSHPDGPAALSGADLAHFVLEGRPRLPGVDLLVIGGRRDALEAALYSYRGGPGFYLVERGPWAASAH